MKIKKINTDYNYTKKFSFKKFGVYFTIISGFTAPFFVSQTSKNTTKCNAIIITEGNLDSEDIIIDELITDIECTQESSVDIENNNQNNVIINENNMKPNIPIECIQFDATISETVETDEAFEKIEEIDEVQKEKKLVALTFDDGPSKHTDRLLNALEENGVDATFFVVGYNINKYPETLKKAYDEGNEIAIHGYSHTDFTKLSVTEVDNEIIKVVNMLNELEINPSLLIRPPYGSLNSKIKKNLNYSFILWNVDTEDWKSKNKDAVIEMIYTHIEEGSIILLHDIHSTTVDAIEEILPTLTDEYEFVTISELFERNEQELELHKSYRKVKLLKKVEE